MEKAQIYCMASYRMLHNFLIKVFILNVTARVSVKLNFCHHFISCYLTNTMIQPADWSKQVSWSFHLLQILLNHRLITH